jgi:hypothetical protein
VENRTAAAKAIYPTFTRAYGRRQDTVGKNIDKHMMITEEGYTDRYMRRTATKQHWY